MEYMLEIAIVVLIIIVMGVLIWFMMRKNEQQKIASHLVGIGYELAKLQEKINEIATSDAEVTKANKDAAKIAALAKKYELACYYPIEDVTNANTINKNKKTYLSELAGLQTKLQSYQAYMDKLDPADPKIKILKDVVKSLQFDVEGIKAKLSNMYGVSSSEKVLGCDTFCVAETTGTKTKARDDTTGACSCVDPAKFEGVKNGLFTCRA